MNPLLSIDTSTDAFCGVYSNVDSHTNRSAVYSPLIMPLTRSDHEQYPASKEFDMIVQEYLDNLSTKKRDKALVNQCRYLLILQVLKDPKNTSISTAQFRFWVKKMFQLRANVVCHDNKPVAMREQIYDILVKAHRKAYHGGRDKTSALVRRRYSWIPKELIARFVRHCPFCISRRNGLAPSAMQNCNSSTRSLDSDHADHDDREDPLFSSPSFSSLASVNARVIAISAAAAAAAAVETQVGIPATTSTASSAPSTVPSVITALPMDLQGSLTSPSSVESLYYTPTESSDMLWGNSPNKQHWHDSPSSCSSLLTPSSSQLGMFHSTQHSYDPYFMMGKYNTNDVTGLAASTVAAQSAASVAAVAAATIASSPFSFFSSPQTMSSLTSPSQSLQSVSSCGLLAAAAFSYYPSFSPSTLSDDLLVRPIHPLLPRHSI